MANFDNGVKGYIIGEVTLKVPFPVSWEGKTDVNCYQCNFFSRHSGIRQLTKQVSEYPIKYIGSSCPLVFDGSVVSSKYDIEN